MAKEKTAFVCSECGYECAKWLGQCPACRAWNTLEETVVAAPEKRAAPAAAAEAVYLKDVPAQDDARWATGFGELDRVLGGGIVEGSVVLAGGEPGIGKSTLLMQVASVLSRTGKKVLYVTGEESLRQVKLRAQRLSACGDILLMAETDAQAVIGRMCRLSPDFVVVDSIQSMVSSRLSTAAGSVSQIRECATLLTREAKTGGAAVFIIGHVTKEARSRGRACWSTWWIPCCTSRASGRVRSVSCAL